MSPFGEYCVNASNPTNKAIKKLNILILGLPFLNIMILEMQAKNGFIIKIKDNNTIVLFLLKYESVINLMISRIGV